MYFLQQIKGHFSFILRSYQLAESEGPVGGAGVIGEDVSMPDVSQLSEIDLAKLGDLEELKKEIDVIQASEHIVKGQILSFGSNLKKIANDDVPGLSPSDPEYIELRAKYERLIGVYDELVGEGQFINQIVRYRLNELNGEVSGQIEEITGENKEDSSGYETELWYIDLGDEEKQTYADLFNQRQEVKTSFESKVTELTPQQREIFGNQAELLQNSETLLDESVSYEDRVDMIERDIDRIQASEETLRLQILLLENPEDLNARHELLGGIFVALPEEQKEGLIGNTIESLTAGDIYSMKARGVDLSTVFLVTLEGELSAGKGTMNSGDNFIVNFGSSDAADKIIGAGDVFPIGEVYSVKINGVEGIRRFSPRPGYYSSNGRYLAIYDGYKVEIGEKREVSSEELIELKIARQERFSTMRRSDISLIINELEGDNPEIPFTTQGDVALLGEILEETGIEGLVYNPETQRIDMPEGMNFGEVKEIMNNYQGVISEIVTYISENPSKIDAYTDGEILILEGMNYSPLLLQGAIRSMTGSSDNVDFNKSTMTITTSDGMKIEDIIGGDYEYTGSGTHHLRYMGELRNAVSGTDVPLGALITLIYHENREWNPTATPGTSSAYGLGQMIDGTWGTYGRGLNRNSPADQLKATVRYMEAIQQRKNASWEHVLAYYNTGEGINSISTSRAREFARVNPAIAALIPGGVGGVNSPRDYFTGAVAYYNDISFEQARATL